jgi:hypothetical protein
MKDLFTIINKNMKKITLFTLFGLFAFVVKPNNSIFGFGLLLLRYRSFALKHK